MEKINIEQLALANKMDYPTVQELSKQVLSGLNGLSGTACKFVLQQAISMIGDLSLVAYNSVDEPLNHHKPD
jgi:hypothetical protein